LSGPFDLGGRVALVTGGTAGIGLGMAAGLAQAGARMVLAGRNPERAAPALAALAAFGGEGRFVQADVSQPEGCAAAVAYALSAFGRLDILINNAGTTVRKRPEHLSLEEWRLVMDTNLTSAFLCSQAAYPAMRHAGGGKIVVVGSMMSLFGAPYGAAYGASKGGVVQLARSLATAWAADNIQVNAILPGWIETELTQGAMAHTPGLRESVAVRAPAGRWGKPVDLAGTAVFLCSAASDFVTGTAIPVDGGYSIRA
jgi:2-deoxy-D-gluconate 3-dehydrogenase